MADGPRGLLFAFGYRRRLPVAAAFTIGSVILFRRGLEDVQRFPELIGHEERHVTQYALCLGLPFLPLLRPRRSLFVATHGGPCLA